MDPEQTVKDFISKVKALKARPLTDYTKEDVDEAWQDWANLAEWIKKGGARPQNLMEGRRWAELLEELEEKLVSF
jgi:hypothetical protein